MGRRKLKYVLPKLNDNGGKLAGPWYIEYSYRNENTGILERFRFYKGFQSLKTAKERYDLAQKIIEDISTKILSGWNPFEPEVLSYENKISYHIHAKAYGNRTETDKNLLYYINLYLEEKEPFLSYKTKQDYRSKFRLFHQWLFSKGKADIYAFEISNDLIRDYIVYLIKEKKRERRTVNDTKQRISQLFNWLIRKGVLTINPVYDLPEAKQRHDHSAQPMTKKEASYLLKHIYKNDKQLHLFCSMIFYCAIRPGTELRLLKIKDINLETEIITIRAENAKTSIGIINIPPKLLEILLKMKLNRYDRDFYIFGKGKEPGPECWGRNYFRLMFNKYRDEIGYPKEYKLYSWKCTGAILFSLSGAPLPAIRDHLRHKSTAYTDIYLSKKLGRQNDYVKNNFPEI